MGRRRGCSVEELILCHSRNFHKSPLEDGPVLLPISNTSDPNFIKLIFPVPVIN